jgi:hypothetical protein
VTRPTLAAMLIAIAACSPNALSPTPSPSASVAVASPTPTPSPAPTTAPPSPTAGRHANAVLGYAATLPPPWRVSGCLSRVENTLEQTYLGQDVLTWHSVAEEQDLGVSGGTGATGAFAWVITIQVQVSAQSASDFAAARAGGSGGKSDPDTIGGRPAARVADGSGNAVAYYVANGGRMYSIQITSNGDSRPAQLSPATFDAIAHSVSFTTPTARPTPTADPVPTAAVEALADAVAAAFAASDADRLHELMTPVCWFNAGYNQSEGSAASRDKVAAGLRTSFTQGLRVTVEPRPIMTKPPMPGSFWIWSTWSAYGVPPRTTPQSNVQLVFDQIDGRWYWVGALFNATR